MNGLQGIRIVSDPLLVGTVPGEGTSPGKLKMDRLAFGCCQTVIEAG